MNGEPLFCVDNLRIQYPNSKHWAVDGVSFTLQPGEKLGLVGESGCGKSTLGRAAMKLLPNLTQIEGKIQFEGQSIVDLNPEALRQFRGEVVGLVFQDPMTRLDPLMTIGDHCIETLQAHQPQLSRKEAVNLAIKTLDKVKIPPNRWAQYPHEFSGGMRQRVAMALALLLNPKMIIADEPTTALDVTVAAEILQELTRLCAEESMGLLLISHDLAMVGEYCDRLAVMNEGKIVEMGKMQDILHHPQHHYTKSLLKAALHVQIDEEEELTIQQLRKPDTIPTTPLLKITNLQQYFTLEGNFLQEFFSKETEVIKAVDQVSFELYPGEILGLVGESGCGKSTLSRTILQLIKATGGSIEFLGEELTKLSDKEMRLKRRQIQMIFQDPHACLNPLMTVGQSIADPLFIHKLATQEEAKNQVCQMLERVKLTPVEDYYDRYPKQLSGGQQQRVAIARALITKPNLVICDEPVSMLDASVQAQVLELMSELKDDFQLTYLFITHDLWVARFFCHRIAVMNQGKIVEIGDTESIFKQPQHPYTQKLLNAAPLLAI
ncbi:ABC transporter ATP-binding protein [Crocosphaera sp. XPORK-15E]|uniref:ABC transporter ATP-binding protein n=1 Tax=Crocosphaera sp. XPORK-15E TaxID=3110247 RepID=UPI002B1E95CF|nr:ABC transporter ATP-binding protein [Crocosphaera sp. XPORK-15E]MEA5533727.1 ABC transporter ATP-binding protein [Crocosphaera sp. XPORK-15E]